MAIGAFALGAGGAMGWTVWSFDRMVSRRRRMLILQSLVVKAAQAEGRFPEEIEDVLPDASAELRALASEVKYVAGGSKYDPQMDILIFYDMEPRWYGLVRGSFFVFSETISFDTSAVPPDTSAQRMWRNPA